MREARFAWGQSLMEKFRSPYAMKQLLTALFDDTKRLAIALHENTVVRLSRLPMALKIAIIIVILLAISLQIYLAVKPISLITTQDPPAHKATTICNPATCSHMVIEDSLGKKATVQFRILAQDSVWKLGSKDYVVSPNQGDIHVSTAFEALAPQNPFENVHKVIAIGLTSQGTKASAKLDEILSEQRADALLDHLPQKFPVSDLYTLNLGRYTGERPPIQQRPPFMVCIFDSEPGMDLEEAVLSALRSKPPFGLDLNHFSKAKTAKLQAGSSSR